MEDDLNFDSEEVSIDDVLEEARQGRDGSRSNDQKLSEDNDTPAAPADDVHDNILQDDHPLTDSDQDSTEIYHEGPPTKPD